MVKSPFSEEYTSFRRGLVAEREAAGVTQVELAGRLNRFGLEMTQSVVSKIERGERRLDVVEFIFLLRALGAEPAEVIAKIEQAFPKRRKGRLR